jgi:hypothetical protein
MSDPTIVIRYLDEPDSYLFPPPYHYSGWVVLSLPYLDHELLSRIHQNNVLVEIYAEDKDVEGLRDMIFNMREKIKTFVSEKYGMHIPESSLEMARFELEEDFDSDSPDAILDSFDEDYSVFDDED